MSHLPFAARCCLVTASAAVAVTSSLAPAAQSVEAAAPAIVDVRVEGATGTLFEDMVLTDGHAVTTAAGGTHHCDGTNRGANTRPGPAATAALDDAAAEGGFTWDGTYSSSFDDYFITRVGPDSQTSSAFWGILLNGHFTPVGGCQQRVSSGQSLLFAYDAFGKSHFLKLGGPPVTLVGRPITVAVTDAQSGAPVAGASVNGATTGPDGRATLTFHSQGIKRLKAERSDSVRSNSLYVFVVSGG